jgi:hypothetical protein
MDSEGHGVSLRERDYVRARLHSRTLLGEHKLAAIEVRAGLGQQGRNLHGKHVGAVQVLVQAVVIAGVVLEQERGRSGLAGPMAAIPKLGVGLGEPAVVSERLLPSIRRPDEPGVELLAHLRHERGQRVGEVLILSASEAVLAHDDAAPKSLWFLIPGGDGPARRRGKQAGQERPAPGVQLELDAGPLDRGDGMLHAPNRNLACRRPALRIM